MQLGFATAILPDLSLEEVLAFAAEEGFECVEVMCWPTDSTDQRRYAGVTHIDVARLDEAGAREVRALTERYGVGISALGYYPNPLAPDQAESDTYVTHLERVIDAAALLGVDVVNTFIGRDPAEPIEAQWQRVEAVWRPLVARAEAAGVKLGIENCPMLFTLDEWPGGKNLAISPAVWDELFERLPSANLGLNFDPSHLVWQKIDVDRALRDYAEKLVHVHLKDERVDGYTNAIVTYQVQMALKGLTAEELDNVVVAYEPVWAIGTGLTATDEQANETIGVVRRAIAAVYGEDVADKVRIQYGGSMKGSNVKGLMAQPEIDGGLIGGASLKAADFAEVVNF